MPITNWIDLTHWKSWAGIWIVLFLLVAVLRSVVPWPVSHDRSPTEEERAAAAQAIYAGARRPAFLNKILNIDYVQEVRQYRGTLWVNVSLGALGHPVELKAQEAADKIATQYKAEVREGICVEITYGNNRQLAKSCVE